MIAGITSEYGSGSGLLNGVTSDSSYGHCRVWKDWPTTRISPVFGAMSIDYLGCYRVFDPSGITFFGTDPDTSGTEWVKLTDHLEGLTTNSIAHFFERMGAVTT